MFPIMCIQPACMNSAVTMVIQCRPATISAGTTDHRCTNASPPISSNTKTIAFATMIAVVTMGKFLGRRDASDNGTIPPMLSSSVFRDTQPQLDACMGLSVISTFAPDSTGRVFGSAALSILPCFLLSIQLLAGACCLLLQHIRFCLSLSLGCFMAFLCLL